MAVSWLHRLAGLTPVPVFPALGMGGDVVLRRLAQATNIELVGSPRHASVLLVAGGVQPDLLEALRRVHDQLPWPSSSLWFRCEPLPELEDATRIDDIEALPGALAAIHRELLLQRRGSSPRLLPDNPPNPWEGLGDDGHGGEGMMGGVPYGRPMAMNMHDDIRDGLTLDSLTFRIGPFFPAFPPGMSAEVTVQGDLVQSWTTQSLPHLVALDPVFHDARQRSVPIARLELARVRYHLHRLFHGLRLAGWESAALHVLHLAMRLTSDSRADALRRRLERYGFFYLAALDGGVLEVEQARRVGGPASRAAGLDDDLRSEDANYQRLGFSPVFHNAGDTRARWQQILAEIEQSLQLAKQAAREDLHTQNSVAIETPRGPWSDERCPTDASRLLDEIIPGLEWDSALATIASLDIAALSDWPLVEDKPLTRSEERSS
ncbi:hypothetical protein L861_06885 [Litchfieldella anticariensis FP35 = DSM 16096]|uniref:NADH-quinone oxidoreductase subunit D domain-containing protein n=1 Tax=Litchfieldella anticariensis (strain DSM 16096 / CECT 5854 / CIP 108499 / LMG 22089 / FP35) TaxID=1121939 RepID=S2KDD6_LITA3|nr:hypothetical protein [Halomonas anticariensis]EPC00212.1 hypothetical protein L861_06885 [Halomonas anticariensis FP35 = DSM 16096]